MRDDHTEIWEQAWQSRDAAFDGRFFIGVRTTGVYCRCTCPVRLPFRRNIDFLPSAAAAEAAGFRPCLRCRPETAPFSPAWNGTRTTVERAARLIIEEGALDGGVSVEVFAARLGVTSRHLNRLFTRHWGASPSAVAKTARVQRAKRLLNETNLPMLEVALQAGFGSLRRFNAVFSEVYKRPPGDIRRQPPK
jgi:AraC family transcriptional regulator of adaptative response / DNA-3-methyladenine glycosylase II